MHTAVPLIQYSRCSRMSCFCFYDAFSWGLNPPSDSGESTLWVPKELYGDTPLVYFCTFQIWLCWKFGFVAKWQACTREWLSDDIIVCIWLRSCWASKLVSNCWHSEFQATCCALQAFWWERDIEVCPLFRGVLSLACPYLECSLFRVSFFWRCPLFILSFIWRCPLFRVSFIWSALYSEYPLFRVSFIGFFTLCLSFQGDNVYLVLLCICKPT